MEAIIIELIKATPVIFFLIKAITYFRAKEKDLTKGIEDKDDHIKELNDAWRKSSDESLKIISKLSNAIDKFTFVSEKNKEEVMNEIDHLKDIISKFNKK